MVRKQLRFGRGFRVAAGNAHSQAAQMVLPPGATEGGPDNCHQGSDQWLYVVAGTGRAIVDGRSSPLAPGTLLLIQRGEHHEIRNTGRQPLATINIYVPPAYDRGGNPLKSGRCDR
ncbi:MAG TPA: cupin domain-containing protein [Pirellulales bacterium]|jgi:mannose-6-phosphate isomerase-like protein (cupin superfamily)|nr:cupin domain-containing protein [Pirellulales bacterium]